MSWYIQTKALPLEIDLKIQKTQNIIYGKNNRVRA